MRLVESPFEPRFAMSCITTRNRRIIHAMLRLGCVAVGLVAALGAGAQTPDWSVHAGVSQSDNIRRTSVDEESETIAEVGLDLKMDTKRPRLDANVDANLSYRSYLGNAYDDHAVGGFAGSAAVGFIPQRFTWLFQDNYGQLADDPFAVETPENRQNVNYFTTGPDFVLPLGDRTSLTAQGLWSDAYYEKTPEDYNRLEGSLELAHRISSAFTTSLNATASRVEYDDETINSSYDVQNAYARFTANGVRTTLSADVGYMLLHDFGESDNGLLARLSFTRKVGALSTLTLDAGTEFSDTGNIFARDQALSGIQLQNGEAVASSDAFRADYGYFSWHTAADRTTVDLGASWREESHETETQLDRELVTANADVSRRLNRSLR